jgi:gluconokinase
MAFSIVFMGVSGCGKSSLATAVAQAEGLTLVEGDDYHSAGNLEKMKNGIALNDADRADWLAILAQQLILHSQGVALTCSALKRAYRQTLRSARPGLRFVFLEIDLSEAQARVNARSATHFFAGSLVASQFSTLETPVGEAGVLRVDATQPTSHLKDRVVNWLHHKELA